MRSILGIPVHPHESTGAPATASTHNLRRTEMAHSRTVERAYVSGTATPSIAIAVAFSHLPWRIAMLGTERAAPSVVTVFTPILCWWRPACSCWWACTSCSPTWAPSSRFWALCGTDRSEACAGQPIPAQAQDFAARAQPEHANAESERQARQPGGSRRSRGLARSRFRAGRVRYRQFRGLCARVNQAAIRHMASLAYDIGEDLCAE